MSLLLSALGSYVIGLPWFGSSKSIPEPTLGPASGVNNDATEVVVVENTSESTLYALIIGINDYPNLKPLGGAVADADQMADFLMNDLLVPPDHITNLRNETASRKGILDAFQALLHDPRINKDDPILIYYAGHGGATRAPPEWKDKCGTNDIQVIFPFDYEQEVAGSKINCIPDKTIATWLNDLSQAKGDNITVIFDSCHSASANRSDAPTRRESRSAGVTFDIPWDIDEDLFTSAILSAEDSRRTSPPLCTHQASHIHFAACGSEELAWEEEGRGAFTSALLKTIRAYGVDKLTYQNLMVSLPILPKQSPHCYGTKKRRILFNSRVPSRHVAFIPVKFEDDTLTLQAGAASGVTFNSVWELHKIPTLESPSIGRFCAGTPSVSTTVLSPEKPNQNALNLAAGTRVFAMQVQCGTGNELKVWFSPEAGELLFPSSAMDASTEVIGSSEHEVGYVAHPYRDTADVAVELAPHSSPRNPEVIFHLCNSEAEKYGAATLRYRKPARREVVEPILFAAAKWNWHLQRTNEDSKAKDIVSMEMMKVAHRTGRGIRDRKYLEEPYEDLANSGVVDFAVKRTDLYGVRLTNDSSVPLYVRMFYFDTTDFAIFDMYGHSVANGRADAELPAQGQLMIGDDREGGEPLPFSLDSGEKLNLGFMKVFWSTDPLQLDNLEQEDVFDQPPSKSDSRKFVKMKAREIKDWGTVMLALVQRAP